MAKKPDFNQAAEIRSILQLLGKEAKFREVFEKLRAEHKGYRLNENSCMQAFSTARAKLGFKKGRRSNGSSNRGRWRELATLSVTPKPF